MRAQQRAGRRSTQTLLDRRELVKHISHLYTNGTLPGGPDSSASGDTFVPANTRFNRLLVGISAFGATTPDACFIALRAIPRRHMVGLLVDIGENPLLSPWAGFTQRHGLDLTTYVPSPDESAFELSEHELLLGTARGLRDPKVDAVCLIGIASELGPVARLVQASGRRLILGVRSNFVDRALRVADVVIDLDAIEDLITEMVL